LQIVVPASSVDTLYFYSLGGAGHGGSLALKFTGLSPAQGSVDQSSATDIVLTFDEAVQAGTGDIVLTPSAGNMANVVVSIAVGDAQVSFSGNVATINPTSNLVDTGGKTYTVTMASGVIQDPAGNPYAGLSGSTFEYAVADTTGPSIVSYTPVQGATDQLRTTSIVLEFDEFIQAGTGDVVLTPECTVAPCAGGDPAGTAVSIDLTDAAQVTFSTVSITVQPAAALDATGMTYTVTMPSGAVKDTYATTNDFTGLTGSTYTFAVQDTTPPTIASYSPTLGDSGQDKAVAIVLTFGDHMQLGTTGDIALTPAVGNQGNTDTVISSADSQVLAMPARSAQVGP